MIIHTLKIYEIRMPKFSRVFFCKKEYYEFFAITKTLEVFLTTSKQSSFT